MEIHQLITQHIVNLQTFSRVLKVERAPNTNMHVVRSFNFSLVCDWSPELLLSSISSIKWVMLLGRDNGRIQI